MKFNKIRLIGLATIDLPIEGALPSDPYILKSADGLGPPEVDVTIADTLEGDGVYQGRRPQSREPVIRIGLNPDHGANQTASEMRSSLYGMLTPDASDIVKMEVIYNDSVVATTEGYIKKIEPAIFSQTPEVQITMACLRPYLEAPSVLYVTPGGTKAAPEILNTGNARTGFHMEVVFNAAVSNWKITDAAGNFLEFDYDFQAGDILAFDTRPGLRGIWVTRNLVTTKIIYSLNSGSKWLMLYGGNNVFSTSDQSFDWNAGETYFLPKYWGV